MKNEAVIDRKKKIRLAVKAFEKAVQLKKELEVIYTIAQVEDMNGTPFIESAIKRFEVVERNIDIFCSVNFEKNARDLLPYIGKEKKK